MARVLILGGGFAGITAAEILSGGAAEEHQITLVSASSRFTFFPALVPMVFGGFEASEVAVDVIAPLQQRGIRFVNGEVLNIAPRSKTVRVTGDDFDGDLHYDQLIIALGRRLATEEIPGFFEYSHHLLGVKAAQSFKKAIDEFHEGSIVLGLCPNGQLPIPICESALALATRFQKEIADKTISITTVFPETLNRALLGSGLFRNIEESFAAKGINLVPSFPIDRIDKGLVRAQDRESIPFDLLMLVPPFKGQAPVQHLNLGEDSNGFARANGKMQVEGLNGVYAAGDIVEISGPHFGYMAMRQAKVAAVNTLVELSGEEPTLEYIHEVEWILGEKYTHPLFFHYGVWDNTLVDFNEDALLGLAKRFRERYGPVTDDGRPRDLAAIGLGSGAKK